MVIPPHKFASLRAGIINDMELKGMRDEWNFDGTTLMPNMTKVSLSEFIMGHSDLSVHFSFLFLQFLLCFQ
jgi:hypothetical protein